MEAGRIQTAFEACRPDTKKPPGGGFGVGARVFDTLDALQVFHEPESRLVSARIDLKLSGRRATVRLKICPERDTILGATGIPEVEEWLVARGFAIGDDRTLVAASACNRIRGHPSPRSRKNFGPETPVESRIYRFPY